MNIGYFELFFVILKTLSIRFYFFNSILTHVPLSFQFHLILDMLNVKIAYIFNSLWQKIEHITIADVFVITQVEHFETESKYFFLRVYHS